jgi:RecJ-like exonuclease
MKINLDYFRTNFFGYSKERFPVTLDEKRSIKSCTKCEGTGRISSDHLANYHKNEYDTFHVDCKYCAGQGRLIVTEIFISFGDTPYNSNGDVLKREYIKHLLFETHFEPYDKDKAKDIEKQYGTKTFHFKIEDVVEK